MSSFNVLIQRSMISRSCLRASEWDFGVNIRTLGSSDHVDGVNIWIAMTGRRQEGQLCTLNLQSLPRGSVNDWCNCEWHFLLSWSFYCSIWFCWLYLHNLSRKNGKSCQSWKAVGKMDTALSLIDAFNTSIVFLPKTEPSSHFQQNTSLFISAPLHLPSKPYLDNPTLLFWFKLRTDGLIIWVNSAYHQNSRCHHHRPKMIKYTSMQVCLKILEKYCSFWL